MKNFYEMLELLEAEQDKAETQGSGLGDVGPAGQAQPQEAGPDLSQPAAQMGGGEPKHYMFFSNLKVIKEKVDAMLAMDASQIDTMLADGHDWAVDHIATSKDDVEEVYNWLAGSVDQQQAPAMSPQAPPVVDEPVAGEDQQGEV